MIAIIIGIDHGYYAIKTRQVSFPSGIIGYDYEPYTMQNVLQYQGKYYVCGRGRQTLVKNKTSNDNYYLLTLAAVAVGVEGPRLPLLARHDVHRAQAVVGGFLELFHHRVDLQQLIALGCAFTAAAGPGSG